jgi:hypothetical protein
MTIDTTPPRSRRLSRTAAVTLGLTLGSLAAPAIAAPPEAWDEPDNGSMLNNLLFLVGVPVLVFLVLALLVYLPSMMRRQSTEPALAFRDRPEWFGGPRKGVSGATAASETNQSDSAGKGGASARW